MKASPEILESYVEAETALAGSGERWLLQILHFREFGIPHPEVAKFYVELHQKRKAGERISARALLKESIYRPARDLFDPGLHPALSAVGTALEKMVVENEKIAEATLVDSDQGVPGVENGIFPDSAQDFETVSNNEDPLEKTAVDGREIKISDAETAEPVQTNKLTEKTLPEQTASALNYRAWISEHTVSTQQSFVKPLPEFLQTLIRPFSMNVSALNNFLACPLQFYFLSLLRAETGDPSPARFGSAVHHALQRLFEKMKADTHERFPFKEEFIADFELYMIQHQNDFTPEEYDRRVAHGRKILAGYYDSNIQSWRKIVLIETSMRNINLNGVPSKGMIDKIEFNGTDVKIVDYKTGNHEYALRQLQKPSPEMPRGGNYWRQAVFYTLLLENRPGKKWFPTSVEISFIEPDIDGRYARSLLQISTEDKHVVMQQITDSWQKIQRFELFDGCQRPDCRWCNLIA